MKLQAPRDTSPLEKEALPINLRNVANIQCSSLTLLKNSLNGILGFGGNGRKILR